MKPFKYFTCFVFILQFQAAGSQVFFSENFETGSRPAGWTEEFVTPPVHTEPWRYRNGGHSPNDNNWTVPPDASDPTRNPSSAYSGTYNAIFFKQGDNNERTKLITPPLDLEGGTKVELSFYLCQVPWTFEGTTGWDVLRIYYKTSQNSPWILLHEFLDPVYEWELQTILLPDLTSTYYIAFEGHTRWGYGTCIDDVIVEEKEVQPYWIGDMQFSHPGPSFIPSGSTDVPLMRIDFRIFGNTGSANLDHVTFTSLNTSDNDIKPGSVRLYRTLNQAFSTAEQVGYSTSFISGEAVFDGLDCNLPQGHSYLWLAVDVDEEAGHGNILNIMIAANSMMANDTLYPSVDQSPGDDMVIFSTRYSEDFEGIHGWALTGEFEVDIPDGMGGAPGNPNPAYAFRGTKVLGTDLTGLGAYPYNYEPNLTETTAFTATSPAMDFFYYKNINLFFQRHLNIEVWDKASIKVSPDNGATWTTIWENTGYVSDFEWIQAHHNIPEGFARTGDFRIRFQLGPTNGLNNYSGWNIDDLYITAEFISRDAGVTEWISPLSGCGHTENEPVTVRITNYGGEDITDPVPVGYSFDGGDTWTVDVCNETIPVGGSVVYTFPTRADLSEPGLRSKVIAKTLFPGDQAPENDRTETRIFVTPTYSAPYHEEFQETAGFWHTGPGSIWEYGEPAGKVITTPLSGNAWITGISQTYGDMISEYGQVVFEDMFATDKNWQFTGEFERNIPLALPYFAISGVYCIGTDLAGLGEFPYRYEPGITQLTANNAITPPIDVSAHSNLNLSFMRFFEINEGDSAMLAVSPDNGTTWHTLWRNSEGEILDEDWNQMVFTIHDSLTYSTQLRIKFSLFHSAAEGEPAHGLNIDNIMLTGDLVDSALFSLYSPCFDLTDLTLPVFEAKIWVDTEPDIDGATLFYSLDGGLSWIHVSNVSGSDEYWNWYSGRNVGALGLDGWSGHTGAWTRVRHLLPPEVTQHGNVQFRLSFAANDMNNNFDGIALNDIRIFDAPHSTGVTSIISPVSDCYLENNEKFTVRIRNQGITDMQAGDTIRIGYNIDREGIIQDAQENWILPAPFPAGTTIDAGLETEFDFSTGGEYYVEVYTIEEEPLFYDPDAVNILYDTIIVDKPVFSLGPDVYTVRPDTVVLNAWAGEDHDYLWQDDSTDPQYQVSEEGTYSVIVTNQIGCFTMDIITIHRLIADAGVSDLVSPLSSCHLGNDVPVTVSVKNFGTDTLNIKDTIFLFGEVNQILFFQDTLAITSNFYPGTTLDFTFTTKADFSLTDIYQLKFYTKLENDYITLNDTLEQDLLVFGFPSVDLGPDREVDGPWYILDAGAGFTGYLWQDGSQDHQFVVEQPGEGTYYVRVTDTHNCSSSDTVNITLNVLDIAAMEILLPETTCLATEEIRVPVRILNAGSLTIPAGESILARYYIDGTLQAEEEIILEAGLLPGTTLDLEFTEMAAVAIGESYDFSVTVSLQDDMKPLNDEISAIIHFVAAPEVYLGPDLQVITALEHILDAGEGFEHYLWQDGSTAQTFLVTTPGISSYSVTVTDHNGCTAFHEVQVMLVIPNIGVYDITDPQNACALNEDETIRVAIKNYGNTNISTAAVIRVAYEVNGSGPVIEDVVLSGTFGAGQIIYHTFVQTCDFSQPGDYSMTAYTIYASDLVPDDDSITAGITVFGEPEVDISGGADTIIVQDPLLLTAPPGYTSYLWQDGSTAGTFLIDEPGAGLYHVKVSDQNECFSSDTIFVIYDFPDIGITRILSPATSCGLSYSETISFEIINNGYYPLPASAGITISYSVNNGGTVSEMRNIGSSLQPSATMELDFESRYDFSAPGTYGLLVSLDFPGDQDISNNAKSGSIDVWGYPVVDLGAGQDTLHVTLPQILDAGSGFASYTWQDLSNARFFTITEYGWYWVIVSNEYGCSLKDSVYIDSVLGINDPVFSPGEIMIYPNPVNDILNVHIETDIVRDYIFELYTVHNQLVYKRSFPGSRIVDGKINVDNLPAGTYILRVIAGNRPATFKILIR